MNPVSRLLICVALGMAAATTPISAAPVDLMNQTLPDLDNKPRRLADWKGKIVVANFWATWCGPCRDEIPEFVQLQNTYRDRGVQFVGIAVDNRKEVAAFAKRYGINYPVLQAEETGLAMMPLAGNTLGGLPFTFIINREGKIVATAPGRISKARLESALQPLLRPR